uniref:Secreted protein n=1 Tax=Rhizophora mucronata TaxID=61149 RepID=A0A2P2Q6M3_RHIMU
MNFCKSGVAVFLSLFRGIGRCMNLECNQSSSKKQTSAFVILLLSTDCHGIAKELIKFSVVLPICSVSSKNL